MLVGSPPFVDEFMRLGVYDQIMKGQIHFPWRLKRQAKDLMKNLMNIDPTQVSPWLLLPPLQVHKSAHCTVHTSPEIGSGHGCYGAYHEIFRADPTVECTGAPHI